MSFSPSTWAPAALQLLCHGDVVFQGSYIRPLRIEDVAGVADRALADLAAVDHRIHGDAHVLDPVEAVEDAEDVDAACRRGRSSRRTAPRCRDRWCRRRRWRRAAASASGCWASSRGCRAGTLPGAFLQEAVGHVKGGAAPAFHRERVPPCWRHRRAPRAPCRWSACGWPAGTGVRRAWGGVGDQQALLRLHPASRPPRGPSRSRIWRVPSGGVSVSDAGGTGSRASARGGAGGLRSRDGRSRLMSAM